MVRLENPRGLAPTMKVARGRVTSTILASPPGQSVPRQNPSADFLANVPKPKVKGTYYDVPRQVMNIPGRPAESCPIDRQDC